MENEAEAHALKENVQYYKYNKTMFIKGKKLKMYPLVQ